MLTGTEHSLPVFISLMSLPVFWLTVGCPLGIALRNLACMAFWLVPAGRIRHALNHSGGPAAISSPTLSIGSVDHMLSLAGCNQQH